MLGVLDFFKKDTHSTKRKEEKKEKRGRPVLWLATHRPIYIKIYFFSFSTDSFNVIEDDKKCCVSTVETNSSPRFLSKHHHLRNERYRGMAFGIALYVIDTTVLSFLFLKKKKKKKEKELNEYERYIAIESMGFFVCHRVDDHLDSVLIFLCLFLTTMWRIFSW